MRTVRFICSLTQITSLIACHATFAFHATTSRNQNDKGHMMKLRQTYPSLGEVFDRICRADIKFPEIVMKQVILETGWLKSKHLMSRNNLFGFRSKNYMRFNNWEDSVAHYKSWQLKKLSDNDNDYYNVLVRARYGAPGYVTHLKKIKWSQTCPLGTSWSSHYDQHQQDSIETALDTMGTEEN
ncbi:MAG: hypothetical protein EBZ64_12475 [Betaproteobacteria bacterium]|nr:hypothetical protein [Betaproteobacteria bacterium]